MSIEIKISKKPIEYSKAINFLESRIDKILKNDEKELIWILEHPSIYTAGTIYKENEIIDKSIDLYKTNRGGKITYHGPGQLICYFALNLNKRNKDIRKFLNNIESVIIKTLNEYKIISFADRTNIGIWVNNKKKIKKIGAIGIKVKKWIAYHGFSININVNLKKYKKIVPCGIKDRDIINLQSIKKQSYNNLGKRIANNLITKFKI
tara:strand:+ start:217 stop:837 length:621 start_codon:yes stop_codon:yes gene_type:complete